MKCVVAALRRRRWWTWRPLQVTLPHVCEHAQLTHSNSHLHPFLSSPPVNRKLHFVGTSIVILMFLLNPKAIPSILFGACTGYLVCPALIGLDHGFIEFFVTIGVYLLMFKLSTGRIGVAAAIPIIGYGFAWFGHFFHELNKPATFIYPVYSLMGDFNMWSRIATGQEAL